MKQYTALLIALLISSLCYSQESLIPAEVQENIQMRVDQAVHPGIVVGVVTPQGTDFYSYGVRSQNGEAVDEHSVFEIGSISKTFTGILLADQVVKSNLSLETPLQALLPDSVTAPTRNGDSIHLYQLSNHTSALPRLPANLSPADPANPYADYSEEQLYDFLDGYELTRDIGSQYEYSNYAVGLLGHVLAARQQTSYEDLMVRVIADPLKMPNTRVAFTPKMKEHLAIGHSYGAEVANWDLPTLAGAGAIRSTAADMIRYVAANMGLEKSELYPALQLSHQKSGGEDSSSPVGLGWHLIERNDSDIIWHNGGTGGYRAFAGFLRGGDKGVVVLTNSTAGVDDIGFRLLDDTTTLVTPQPSIATEIKKVLDREGTEAALQRYQELKEQSAEEYNFSEDQLNSLGYTYLEQEETDKALAVFKLNVEAFPTSSNAYDSYAEALMKNEENEQAIANYKKSVELNPGNANGRQMLARLGVDTTTLVTEVDVDEATLETYVGEYQLAPGFILTVTRDGSQLIAQATGQPAIPVFAKSEREFYWKVVDAQLRFNTDEEGNVVSATLFQAGMEIVGKKVE